MISSSSAKSYASPAMVLEKEPDPLAYRVTLAKVKELKRMRCFISRLSVIRARAMESWFRISVPRVKDRERFSWTRKFQSLSRDLLWIIK